jgi:D-beta-D-heptose 7-phosphate kinase / D-beta-D-heptose 1-phosphate adenosyltransferase
MEEVVGDVSRVLSQIRELSPELPTLLREAAPHVIVVGDFLLDGWWYGRSERISREAPVPVVELVDRQSVPGGAANTAMNVSALGGRVEVRGIVGDDEAGRTLARLLEDGGVDVRGLERSADVTTVTKNRVISGDQIVLRVDEVQRARLSDHTVERFEATVRQAWDSADAVIICDYGFGTFTEPVIQTLAGAPRPRLLVVDSHNPAAWAPLRPDAITPNATEAFSLLGGTSPDSRDRASALAERAGVLLDRTAASVVLATLDCDGSVLLTADSRPHRTFARRVSERQASGAGDTFVAAFTLGRAAGLALPLAADLAQAAAESVVQRLGTSVCTSAELAAQLDTQLDIGPLAAIDADELVSRVVVERAAGKRIVLTNGCFDVLHRGHTTYLAQAARLGEVLVVAVNSDASVSRLKGPDRPINTATDRGAALAALASVDYVTIFDTDTPIPLLERLQPDVYAKGGDYSPEMLEEAAVVESYGGEVAILDYVPTQSTTELLARIRGGARVGS